jgi:two-component system, NtrC family, response regulator HydG
MHSRYNILIVDDDPDICSLLQRFLEKKEFKAHYEHDGRSATDWLKTNSADLVLLDFKLPDYTGIEVLQKIKVLQKNVPVIMITGYSDMRIAIEALKKGAHDYVTKPLHPDEILMIIRSAISESLPAESKPNLLRTKKFDEYIVGPSHQSETVQKHIDLIAPTDMSVIIMGETGTGKEYVARAIHSKSLRSEKPFVAVDCGAMPNNLVGSELFGHVKGAFTGAINDKKGCFELANGGTLFLDEIGNLGYENQNQLLRVLQEKRVKKIGDTKDTAVDVRVIAATNDNLKAAIDQGKFRHDIFHRLNEFIIELAPLRDRPEDIEEYAIHFMKIANQQLGKNVRGFSDKSLQVIKNHVWEGNLRELRNVIKRAVLLSKDEYIDLDHLPPEVSQINMNVSSGNEVMFFDDNVPRNLKSIAEQAEKQAIIEVLRMTNYNKTKAANLLEIDRKTLYNKLKAYGIKD